MNNRYDFLYLFDCIDANPNGDPDAGNLPRLDPETGQGLATDVMLKRKIRNFVQTTKTDSNQHIFVQEKRPLNPLIAEACSESGLESYKKSDGSWDKDKAKKRPQTEIKTIQQWMCSRYFDIRSFGAVLSTGPNGGQIRGPVQISFSRSIDRIVTAEHTITRLTDVDKEEGEMGRKFTVPYGLYKAQGFVNPFLADQTGFSDDDLKLLFTALENAFQFDQSAARPAGSMNPRALIVFKHDSQLGNAPSHKLFELVTVAKKDGVEVPRAFSDYEVKIDREALPNGVEIIERL
ncbi:type I-C CRISPR-associated protein Cas7/Csd2 [Luteolibacter algae]|uniref:Type I-C CRISPR-associated protein Cas7/Csd2 n=1 Tax=Luteolibacter algae TaxID=454151 RepID=A0ABW5D5A5_9BACT